MYFQNTTVVKESETTSIEAGSKKKILPGKVENIPVLYKMVLTQKPVPLIALSFTIVSLALKSTATHTVGPQSMFVE